MKKYILPLCLLTLSSPIFSDIPTNEASDDLIADNPTTNQSTAEVAKSSSSIPTPPAGPVPTSQQLASGEFNQASNVSVAETAETVITPELSITQTDTQEAQIDTLPASGKGVFTISDDEKQIISNVDAVFFIKGLNPEIRIEHNSDGTITMTTQAAFSLENPSLESGDQNSEPAPLEVNAPIQSDVQVETTDVIATLPEEEAPSLQNDDEVIAIEEQAATNTSSIPVAPPLPSFSLHEGLTIETASEETDVDAETAPLENSSENEFLKEIQNFTFNKKNRAERSSNNATPAAELSFADQIAAQQKKVTSGSAKRPVRQKNVSQETQPKNSLVDEINNFQFGKNKPAKYTPNKKNTTSASTENSNSWKQQQENKIAQNRTVIEKYTAKYGISQQQFIRYLQELVSSESMMVPYNQVKDLLGITRSTYAQLQQDVKYNLFTEMQSNNGIILSDLQAVPTIEQAASVKQSNGNAQFLANSLKNLRASAGYDDEDDNESDSEDDEDEDWYEADANRD